MVWVDGLFFGCGSGGLSSVPIVVSFEERTIGAAPPGSGRSRVHIKYHYGTVSPGGEEGAYKVSLRHSMSLFREEIV